MLYQQNGLSLMGFYGTHTKNKLLGEMQDQSDDDCQQEDQEGDLSQNATGLMLKRMTQQRVADEDK